jgi:predicted DCC family thiol-disulfide oxidoreductase YuxK
MAGAETLSQQTIDGAKGKGIVLFDGNCLLCQRSVRILMLLDWRKKLEFQDCRDTANLPACDVPLEAGELLEQMHLVTPDRRQSYKGFAAFRWMAWRMPPTWIIAPFLHLPGARWIGNKVYLWVARNRYHLVPCKDGVCTLPNRSEK